MAGGMFRRFHHDLIAVKTFDGAIITALRVRQRTGQTSCGEAGEKPDIAFECCDGIGKMVGGFIHASTSISNTNPVKRQIVRGGWSSSFSLFVRADDTLKRELQRAQLTLTRPSFTLSSDL